MDALFAALGNAIGTAGPVAVTLVACFAIWVRWGKRVSEVVMQPSGQTLGQTVIPTGQSVAPEQQFLWHVENRDTLRDTNERTKRMIEMQEDELSSLRNLVTMQERIALILERVESKMNGGTTKRRR